MATAKRTGWATFWPWPNGTMSFDAMALDATTDKVAQIFCCEESDTITHFGFRYGSRTGTPPVYIGGYQALDASGNPDGTYLGGGSPASGTFTPPADATWNSTWQWVALANGIALTRGTMYARVIEYSSGTINGSNFSSFNQTVSIGLYDRWGIGYTAVNTGAGWSKTTQGLVAYKSATTVYGLPLQAYSTSSLGTNGHRATCKLTIPTNLCSTYKVRGLRLLADSESAAGSNKFGVWNAAGTALQTNTLDSDAHVNPTNTKRALEVIFPGTLEALSAGTPYYFGIERVGSTCLLDYLVFAAANDLLSQPYQGDAILATWNGSAWADTTTGLPPMELMLEDVTAPAGGGGLVSPIIFTDGGLIIRGAA